MSKKDQNCSNPREIVKDLISQHISRNPRKISLRLYWYDNRSIIDLSGENLKKTAEYPQTISFTSFAYGVLEAYRDVYGELQAVPVSFREEIYRNGKVSLDLYPTGSAGILDIFIHYR